MHPDPDDARHPSRRLRLRRLRLPARRGAPRGAGPPARRAAATASRGTPALIPPRRVTGIRGSPPGTSRSRARSSPGWTRWARGRRSTARPPRSTRRRSRSRWPGSSKRLARGRDGAGARAAEGGGAPAAPHAPLAARAAVGRVVLEVHAPAAAAREPLLPAAVPVAAPARSPAPRRGRRAARPPGRVEDDLASARRGQRRPQHDRGERRRDPGSTHGAFLEDASLPENDRLGAPPAQEAPGHVLIQQACAAAGDRTNVPSCVPEGSRRHAGRSGRPCFLGASSLRTRAVAKRHCSMRLHPCPDPESPSPLFAAFAACGSLADHVAAAPAAPAPAAVSAAVAWAAALATPAAPAAPPSSSRPRRASRASRRRRSPVGRRWPSGGATANNVFAVALYGQLRSGAGTEQPSSPSPLSASLALTR